MAISSINFQKAKAHSYDHNFRKDLPNYLLNEQDRKENFYWKNSKEPKEIFNDEMKILDEKKARGKRASFKNSHWEAVLNLNSNHSLDDVKKVAEHIEKKFNITCSTIAVHRDEGHYPLKKDGTKSDKAVYNYHAHINFITVKQGKQMWRKELITRNKLRELQTEVAEILGMQRGEDKRISKTERLEHKQYKQEIQKQEKLKLELENTKEKLKDEILSKKEIKEQFEAFRKQSIGKGYAKEFYRDLSDENKKELQEPSKTQEQINDLFTELIKKHTTKEKGLFKTTKKTDWEAVAREQHKINIDLNAKNDDLKQIAIKAIDFIDEKVKIDLNAKFELLNLQNEKDLKEKLKTEREKLEKAQIEAEQEKQRAKDNYQIFLKRTKEINQSQAVEEIKTTKNKEIQSLKANNTELNQELANYKKIANDERELKRLYINDLQEAKQKNEKLEAENKELKKYIERLKSVFSKAWTNLKPLKGKLRKLLSKPKDKEPKKYQRLYLASNGRAMIEKYTESEYQKLDEKIKKNCSLIETKPKKQEIKRQGPTRDYF